MARMIVTEENSTVASSGVLLMTWRELLRVALIGAVVGLATFALTVVIDKYIITTTFCSGQDSGVVSCDSKEYMASAAATIMVAIGALFALVQSRVYRPLLVVLLAVAGLWNITILALNTNWIISSIAMMALFAIAYATFSWLVQIRNFLVALVLGIVIVVLMRLIISA
ncbi:hypothetical protein H6796_02740 [Candidatus Nomurabacteria bacterium]|nr:hypothetical protein [Candidatus Nomurabacteria bacterium]